MPEHQDKTPVTNRGEHPDVILITEIWRATKAAFREILSDCRCNFRIERGSLTARNQKDVIGFMPLHAQTLSKAIPTIWIELPPERLQRNTRVIEKLAMDVRNACWLLQPYFRYFQILINGNSSGIMLQNTHQRITLLEVPGFPGAYIHWKAKDANELAKFLLNPLEYWKLNTRDLPYADNENRHFQAPSVFCS